MQAYNATSRLKSQSNRAGIINKQFVRSRSSPAPGVAESSRAYIICKQDKLADANTSASDTRRGTDPLVATDAPVCGHDAKPSQTVAQLANKN
jgi:hypothetical protein